MTIKHYPDMVQGSGDWLSCRMGLLTASTMKLILTPTLKVAANDKERAHVNEIAAQRISGFIEDGWSGDNFDRGHSEEIEARELYQKHYAPVDGMGFITNDEWGFTIGFSPDGLVGTDGFIETKSRIQKHQVQTIVDRAMPDDFVLQVQSGLLVSGRKWCDFISYCDGLPMFTVRVFPDAKIQEAIVAAATEFERRVTEKVNLYIEALKSGARLIPTKRIPRGEMF